MPNSWGYVGSAEVGYPHSLWITFLCSGQLLDTFFVGFAAGWMRSFCFILAHNYLSPLHPREASVVQIFFHHHTTADETSLSDFDAGVDADTDAHTHITPDDRAELREAGRNFIVGTCPFVVPSEAEGRRRELRVHVKDTKRAFSSIGAAEGYH